jgi:hypothetical protein
MQKTKNIFVSQELTPAHLRCSWGGCPSVFSLSDGQILIIGKKPSLDLYSQVQHKVADDEFAIVVSCDLLQNVKNSE